MTKTSTIEKLAGATVNDPRWASLIGRDASSDGKFYYSVKTTGVYCRPSCAARPARPENVQFHLTCGEAEKAGFRPCKRCKPDQTGSAEQIATELGVPESTETIYLLLEHLAANGRARMAGGGDPGTTMFLKQ